VHTITEPATWSTATATEKANFAPAAFDSFFMVSLILLRPTAAVFILGDPSAVDGPRPEGIETRATPVACPAEFEIQRDMVEGIAGGALMEAGSHSERQRVPFCPASAHTASDRGNALGSTPTSRPQPQRQSHCGCFWVGCKFRLPVQSDGLAHQAQKQRARPRAPAPGVRASTKLVAGTSSRSCTSRIHAKKIVRGR
jgi:hypothetical protein